ncbi:PAS domain-containing protein [Seonamhaeicola sp.]|uniref:PAS domain-containing protein n=1 Tax=Seonamhaeicola sp. TaxID=1912245 RepID=UPI00261667DA|nr:PAS domain-containing protein [Seonamhaeicola sp.]
MKFNSKIQSAPLLCWDIYGMYLFHQSKNFNKQVEIEILNGYKRKFEWLLDLDTILTKYDFEALVLTDANQKIEWVNKGFTKMTGYPANYAKGKKPNFLQGEATSEKSLDRIRKKLKEGKEFKETLVNYRKNRAPYNCAIHIFPLKDTTNTIRHLLALENQIS